MQAHRGREVAVGRPVVLVNDKGESRAKGYRIEREEK